MPKGPPVNNQIRAERVRVIDETGKNLGELSLADAIAIARQRDLDLIAISIGATPPVCKIVDLGKWRYEQAKKERAKRAHQKHVEIKGVRITVRSSLHDLATRARQAEKFLAGGNKVRVEMILRGREKAHQDFARNKFKEFVSMLVVSYTIEQDIKREPRGLSLIIAKAK